MQFIKTHKKIKNNGFYGVILFFAAAICILGFTSSASQGALRGLKISSSIIIPSLFPFTVFSVFFEKSGGLMWISKKAQKVSMPILRCRGTDFSVILLSLLGGYPIGAKLSNELYKQGGISHKEAKRLLMFSVNPGPAFIIAIVGKNILKSNTAGLILFSANTLACLILNLFLNILDKENKTKKEFTVYENMNVSDAFVESVYEGTRVIINICAFVTLFSCISEIMKPALIKMNCYSLVCPLLEISFGINEVAELGLKPYFYSLLLSFGGLSTICQIKQAGENIAPSFGLIIISRIIHGITATAFSYVLFKIFPISRSVISNGVDIKFEYPLFIPSMVLLVFAVMFLMFLNQQKEKIRLT